MVMKLLLFTWANRQKHPGKFRKTLKQADTADNTMAACFGSNYWWMLKTGI